MVPADRPEGYAAVPLDDLVNSLRTRDAGTASAVLAEATAVHDEPYERIESAERRATTLQGTVAIAASAAVAGATLLLDVTTVGDDGWRLALAFVLLAAVSALLMCAVRAVGVTGRIFQFEEPGSERITLRASMSEADALTFRAAELLRAAAVADMIASVKVGLLRAAVSWFRIALILLAFLAVLICALVVADVVDPKPAAGKNASSSTRQLSPPSRGGTGTTSLPPEESADTTPRGRPRGTTTTATQPGEMTSTAPTRP